MNRFAALIDRLANEAQTAHRISILCDYLKSSPDPERGLALGLLAGKNPYKAITRNQIRAMVEKRVDHELFQLSRNFLGDALETIALIWPARPGANRPPGLEDIVNSLKDRPGKAVCDLVESWLDALTPDGRYALIKLLTGTILAKADPGLVQAAIAKLGDLAPADIKALWHSQSPPYRALLAYAEGQGPRPAARDDLALRPQVAPRIVRDEDIANLDLGQYRAQWVYRGLSVQWISDGTKTILLALSGENVTQAFPELQMAKGPSAPVASAHIQGVVQIMIDGAIQPTSALQKRLARQRATPALIRQYPAILRAYDLLGLDGQDLRELSFDQRHQLLIEFLKKTQLTQAHLVPPFSFPGRNGLVVLHDALPGEVDGLLLSSVDGRDPLIWPRKPDRINAILLYATRGQGRYASQFTEFTFGLWRAGQIVPIGRAQNTLAPSDLSRVEVFVAENTIDRFGPVRVVAGPSTPGLVMHLEFDGVDYLTRHKAGFGLRGLRISAISWDMAPAQADSLASLVAPIPDSHQS
jgi:DNA ligase-1